MINFAPFCKKDFILNNQPKVVMSENYVPNSMLSKYLSEKFSETYNTLNENELKLVSSVISANDEERANIYETTKKDLLTTVNESIKKNSLDVELKGKLLDVKERLLESTYNKESFVSDIVKIINLKQNLSD